MGRLAWWEEERADDRVAEVGEWGDESKGVEWGERRSASGTEAASEVTMGCMAE